MLRDQLVSPRSMETARKGRGGNGVKVGRAEESHTVKWAPGDEQRAHTLPDSTLPTPAARLDVSHYDAGYGRTHLQAQYWGGEAGAKGVQGHPGLYENPFCKKC